MNRLFSVLAGGALALAAAVLAAGCESESPTEKAGDAKGQDTAAAKQITAVEPRPRAESVTRQPRFRWRLPALFGIPTLVTFKLYEVGRVADPTQPGPEPREIGIASGLHDVSPTEFDPFHPPAGAVMTGALCDMPQLKPDTWYRWTIRAIGDVETAEATFHFRTRSESATPAK